MDLLARHEKFEIEALAHLNSGRLLDKLVFGGGTMLRLCHELNRYSADLDFWLIKQIDPEKFLAALRMHLEKIFEITDCQNKHFSLLVEVRSPDYPKRLKLEIRKDIQKWDTEKTIAFSKHSNRQVLVITHTLAQTMLNKIDALFNRQEIRDAFDIEFLLRKGVLLPDMSVETRHRLKQKLQAFSANEFKVKLGSLLESDMREYYVQNQFRFVLDKI